MLHTETVAAGTLALLKSIMALPELESFSLAGGTALSLQIGHRISVDLDFFGQSGPLESLFLPQSLNNFGSVELLHASNNIMIFKVNGIKVDFVNYSYPLVSAIKTIDHIRLMSLQDIAAMKLAAITGRGRKRDFGDLFFLMQHFELIEILQFYQQKYHDGNLFLVHKSLTYFEDADFDLEPQYLIPCTWEEVKKAISKAAKKL